MEILEIGAGPDRTELHGQVFSKSYWNRERDVISEQGSSLNIAWVSGDSAKEQSGVGVGIKEEVLGTSRMWLSVPDRTLLQAGQGGQVAWARVKNWT